MARIHSMTIEAPITKVGSCPFPSSKRPSYDQHFASHDSQTAAITPTQKLLMQIVARGQSHKIG